MTAPGAKCRAAKVDLPEPAAPISSTRAVALNTFGGCGHDAAVEMSDRSTPARRLSAADFSVSPARVSCTAWRKDAMVASYVDRSTGKGVPSLPPWAKE